MNNNCRNYICRRIYPKQSADQRKMLLCREWAVFQVRNLISNSTNRYCSDFYLKSKYTGGQRGYIKANSRMENIQCWKNCEIWFTLHNKVYARKCEIHTYCSITVFFLSGYRHYRTLNYLNVHFDKGHTYYCHDNFDHDKSVFDGFQHVHACPAPCHTDWEFYDHLCDVFVHL